MTGARIASIDDDNPWPGLGAFDEAAERFFNGRRREAAALRRMVLQAPLTVLFSASGLGKTSLLQAGLFPLLRKDRIVPVYVRLDFRDRSGPLVEQLKYGWEAQARAQWLDAPDIEDQESLWHYLHRSGLELWNGQNQLVTPLFILDQFEEVFTLGAERPDAIRRLRTDLADFVENRVPASLANLMKNNDEAGKTLSLDSQRYKTLLSFREDFLPAIEGWKGDLPSIMRNRVRLLPMSGDQAFEAVHVTAPHLANEALAKKIVRFVAAAQEEAPGLGPEVSIGELAVEPALLSLVCRGLNERRKAQGKPAFDEALLSQAGQSIISDYYEEAVGDLPERVQRFIEKELITERGFRKPCDVDDARSAHGVTDSELRLLVDRRLLRIEPQRGTERVELTHDRLTSVVLERRQRQRAREKAARQRRVATLFAFLGIAVVALAVVFYVLYHSAEHQRFVAETQTRAANDAKGSLQKALDEVKEGAKKEEAARIEAEKQTGIAVTAAQTAEAAKRDAELETQIATTRRMASQSDAALARFPQRALLLAVEAAKSHLKPNEPLLADAEQALRRALSRVGGLAFGGADAPISSTLASRDGRWLAMAGANTAYLLDLTSRGPAQSLGDLGIPESRTSKTYAPRLWFSRDGRFLVAMAPAVVPIVWDLSSGTPVRTPLSGASGLGPTVIPSASEDGRWLLCQSTADSITLWDLMSPAGTSKPFVLKREAIKYVDAAGNMVAAKQDDDSFWGAVSGYAGRFESADPAQLRLDVVMLMGLPATSPDGRWMVTGKDDGLQLVDRRASDPAVASRALKTEATIMWGVHFSENSRRMAILTQEGIAHVWDLTATDPVAHPVVLQTPRDGIGTSVSAGELSADGSWLITANLSNQMDPNRAGGASAWLWDLRLPNPASKRIELKGHENGVSAIALTPDNRWAITASDAGPLRLWALGEKDPAASPLILQGGHERSVYLLSVTKDGRWLVTHARDGSDRVWDLHAPQSTASPLRAKAGSPFRPVAVMAVSPDSRWFATTGNFNSAILWDLRASNPTANPIPLDSSGNRITSFWFSPDGHWLATGSESYGAELFDLTASVIPSSMRSLIKAFGSIDAFTISPDSRWLALSRKNEARLWSLKQPSGSFEPILLSGHKETISRLLVSGDSRWLATMSSEAVRLWDLAGKEPAAAALTIGGHAKRIVACRFTADSRRLISASDDRIQVWDLVGRAPAVQPRSLEGPLEGIRLIDLSPDGRWLVTAGEGNYPKIQSAARLWDLQNRQSGTSHVLTSHWSFDQIPTFTPDGHWLVTIAGDRDHQEARLWDLRASNPAGQSWLLRGHDLGVGTVIVSGDSHWLATGGAHPISGPDDRTVRVWNLKSKDPSSGPLVLLGHESGRPRIKFTRDNRWLITGSDDATLRFWDLNSEYPTAAPIVSTAESKVTGLEASPDGRFVISNGEDGIVRLWHMRPEELIGLATTAAGRNFSAEEWGLYFPGKPYHKTFPGLPMPAPVK
jgi:WD40 repeat protein